MKIETDRLLLVPRTIEYLDDCLAMDRDPEVTRYIPRPWNNPTEHIAFIRQRMSLVVPDRLGYFAVLEKSSTDFLGWVMLLPFRHCPGVVEIGWRFNRSCWGVGYASEAALELKQIAIETHDVHTLVAEVMLGNDGSIKLAKKLGLSSSKEYEVEHELYLLKLD